MQKIVHFLLLLQLIACTYSPDEEYFTEISKPDPEFSISLNSQDDQDTIFVYKPTEFSFTTDITTGKIKEAQVLVGDKLLYEVRPGTSGKFRIDAYNYLRTGVYELTIQFISSSGSGSLADKVDAENIQVWRKWIMKVDVDPPPVPVLMFSKENGFLKVSWAPFMKPTFLAYQLNVSSPQGTGRRIIITDPSQSSWIDSGYVSGYKIDYNLYVRTVYNSSATGSAFHNTSQKFKLTSYNPADSTAVLSWSRPTYESTFKSYVLKEGNTNNPIVITNIDDTTRVLKLKNVLFGRQSSVEFSVESKYAFYTLSKLSIAIPRPVLTKAVSGKPILTYNVGTKSIVGLKGTSKLCIYDSEVKLTDSITVSNLTNPPKGNLVYSAVATGINQLNLSTREQKEMSVGPVSNLYRGTSNIYGSENNLVSYGYTTLTSPSYYRYVEVLRDFATGTVIHTTSQQYLNWLDIKSSNPVLSVDGRFAKFYDKSIYKITNGSLQFIKKIPTFSSFIDFRGDNSEEILVLAPNQSIDIYDSNTMTVKRNIRNPNGVQFSNYDPGSKRIMYTAASGETLHFIHIDTKEATQVKAYSSGGAPYILLDGYLFHTVDFSYIKIF